MNASKCHPRAPIGPLARSSPNFSAALARKDWLLWQMADSAFPSGGFAHSGGLEAALQQNEVGGPRELESFLEASLRQFGHASLPFMTSAFEACDDSAALRELDGLCDNFITNHVANRASRLQGKAMMASARSIFSSSQEPQLPQKAIEALAYGHLAPVFGMIVRWLDVTRLEAGRLFFFLHLRGLASAAVRLGIVGPLGAQMLQCQLAPRAEIILLRCQSVTIGEIAQCAPLLDLWQGNQDRLYSRLFQS